MAKRMFLVILAILAMAIGCSSESATTPTATNRLTDQEIDVELAKYKVRIDELSKQSIESIVDARRQMRDLDSDMDDLRGSDFELDKATREAVDSMSKFKHSTALVSITRELQTVRDELDKLGLENPLTSKFAELIAQLQATIDYNMEFMNSLKK